MATRAVNNGIYANYGDCWYDADDDPVALLRAESRLYAPWIAEHAGAHGVRRIVDVGCGAGFISNHLARRGFELVGVDAAEEAMAIAAKRDVTGHNRWITADARALPFPDASFDAACAMDLLEHVSPIDAVIGEIARVLVPGGLLFFHTFNRNWLSWLIVIKGVEVFVRNTPRDMHVLSSFVRPMELEAACKAHGLIVRDMHGCAPRLSGALVRMLATGKVPRDLEFGFSRDTLTSYGGIAEKVK